MRSLPRLFIYNQMIPHEKTDYYVLINTSQRFSKFIFEDHPGNAVINRFGWVQNSVLADLVTFVDGVRSFIKNPEPDLVPGRQRGGGNLSISILVCTSLELVHYTMAKPNLKIPCTYNAEENVKDFNDSYSTLIRNY